MKGRITKAGILAGIFIIAIVISSLVINRGTDDKIADMGAPTLPELSFLMDGKKINPLYGYVDDMDITAMRDTVTPIGNAGELTVAVDKNGNRISQVEYEVYSLDGKETYKNGAAEISEEEGTAVLKLGNILSDQVQEAVLKVILPTEDRRVSFYTRIVRPGEITASECLSFAQDFHTKALEKSAPAELEAYLEPGEESDNTTYQTVNIHSDINHIQWGDLNPQIDGEVKWSLKETNTVYTSILAEYLAVCQGDSEETELFHIKEFFRVRYIEGTIYLLDYDRDMQQIFSGESRSFDEEGIRLGIASDDLQYETNKDGTLVAFVQERELWLYNREDNELSQVFSFASGEGRDERSLNDGHSVRIIRMDNAGNLSFLVCGYMNQGIHEGRVGACIYYYDADSGLTEEKAFIPSTQAAEIAERELGQMVYYDQNQSILYVLADGSLYQIDLDREEQTVLAEGLEDGQYAVSEDGQLMAYQTDAAADTSSAIRVIDLESGEGYTVEAAEGESVRPLGFVNGDFVYGKIDPQDAGTTALGEEITPMYEVEIRSMENKEQAKYTFVDQNIYTTDILIEGNLLTLNRVTKNGNSYSAAAQEYITNNKERSETAVTLDTYTTDVQETQVRLTFADGSESLEPEVLRAEQITDREPATVSISGDDSTEKFYVYGLGELKGIYDQAGYAVQRAEQVSGVVVSSDQAYVWEKGNRDLVYATGAAAFTKEDGETSLEACERYMEQYEAQRIDLTGCTLDQVLYVINKGCPLIALTDTDHAVLLTGYTLTDITYIDPDEGGEYTVGINEMENMVQNGGNTFIGYIR